MYDYLPFPLLEKEGNFQIALLVKGGLGNGDYAHKTPPLYKGRLGGVGGLCSPFCLQSLDCLLKLNNPVIKLL